MHVFFLSLLYFTRFINGTYISPTNGLAFHRQIVARADRPRTSPNVRSECSSRKPQITVSLRFLFCAIRCVVNYVTYKSCVFSIVTFALCCVLKFICILTQKLKILMDSNELRNLDPRPFWK